MAANDNNELPFHERGRLEGVRLAIDRLRLGTTRRFETEGMRDRRMHDDVANQANATYRAWQAELNAGNSSSQSAQSSKQKPEVRQAHSEHLILRLIYRRLTRLVLGQTPHLAWSAYYARGSKIAEDPCLDFLHRKSWR